MQTRNTCVICCSNLVEKYIHTNQPLTYCPKSENQPYEHDIFADFTYGACVNCGSVQLMTLANQEILYADPHNITYNTPTWVAHHKSFANFIEANLGASNKIVEVGGSSCILAKYLLPTYEDYTILDFCVFEPPSGIKFVQGNCETYNFKGVDAVLMSHLFEHLYEPRKFIENLNKSDVKYVGISVPNLVALLEDNSFAVIHKEHTFYFDKNDVEYMFSCYGYKLINYNEFKKHSLFMLFEKKDTDIHTTVQWDTVRAEHILNTFYSRDKILAAVTMANNALIVPAGIYGQLIYTHTKHEGAILGFLDNDPSKQMHRLYGTNYNIYPFDLLHTMDTPHVYIYGGPYTEEIKKQILDIQPTTIIHDI